MYLLLAMRLVVLLLFQSLTASPACKIDALLACLLWRFIYIYLYTVFQCSAPKYSYAYSVVYSYNRISGKLTATVNLINFLGG